MQASARTDLFEIRNSTLMTQPIFFEGFTEEACILVAHLLNNGIIAELAGLAAEVNSAGIHRIAQALGGIAANNHGAALHHKACHIASVAAHHNQPALLRHACARPDMPFDDNCAATNRGSCSTGGVA